MLEALALLTKMEAPAAFAILAIAASCAAVAITRRTSRAVEHNAAVKLEEMKISRITDLTKIRNSQLTTNHQEG